MYICLFFLPMSVLHRMVRDWCVYMFFSSSVLHWMLRDICDVCCLPLSVLHRMLRDICDVCCLPLSVVHRMLRDRCIDRLFTSVSATLDGKGQMCRYVVYLCQWYIRC